MERRKIDYLETRKKLEQACLKLGDSLHNLNHALENLILNSPESLFEMEEQELIRQMFKNEDSESFDLAVCYRNELLRRGQLHLKYLIKPE